MRACVSVAAPQEQRAQNKGAGEKALPGEKLPIDSGGFLCYLTWRAFLCQLPDDLHWRAGAKGVKTPLCGVARVLL